MHTQLAVDMSINQPILVVISLRSRLELVSDLRLCACTRARNPN